MSNVLKSVYFNVDAKQKHIIDSEQRMEELIPQMYTAEESKQDFYTFQPLTAEELASGQAQSFQDGIPVIHMDDVREEERQKLMTFLQRRRQKQRNLYNMRHNKLNRLKLGHILRDLMPVSRKDLRLRRNSYSR